jgi:acid phosphatase family membrane protein YuiD
MTLFQNRILLTGCAAWVCSQVTKLVIYMILNKRWAWERLFGDGGMPSAHSATVVSVAVAIAFECGLSSPLFALSAFFAFITMHDASGVRLETGKQAKAINDIFILLSDLTEDVKTPEQKLKEFVGHTKLQVIAGGLLGLVVTGASYVLF